MKKATSMKQIIESGNLKRFIDPRIIAALGHPFREHVLAESNAGIVSATQIGEGVGADVPLFYKHIERLEELDCIERVDSQPRRGGMEHFFRAKSTLFFDDESWAITPRSIKEDTTSSILGSLIDEVSTTARGGHLNAGNDVHVSWTPGRFDRQAWDEASRLLEGTLSRLDAIMHKSAERLAERNERGASATVGLLGFKTGKRQPDQPDRSS